MTHLNHSQSLSEGGRPLVTESVVQSGDTILPVQIGLAEDVRRQSVLALNHVLAHALALRDLYKKNHWQTSGPNFYSLHLLFDKHGREQTKIADALAERVQTLGGVALAMPHDVWLESAIAHAPRARESVRHELLRVSSAHALILSEVRVLARAANERGDDGTNDLLVSEVVRTNETQSWFIGEHLLDFDAAESRRNALFNSDWPVTVS